MKFTILLSILIISFFTMFAKSNGNPSKHQLKPNQSDSLKKGNENSDSIQAIDLQESSFQEYLDGVDTFAWDNKMINSGHFESKDLKDTIKIILVDTAKHIYYYHPFKNYTTSGFSHRRWGYHFGMDIKLNKGNSVIAAFDGIVRVTKFDRRGFGNVVVIRHPSGLETIYGHLSKVLVASNHKVHAGELVGLGGGTGHSTGTHLHFEVRYLGEPIDPNYFIDFKITNLKAIP